MAEVDRTIDYLNSYASSLQSTIKAKPMELRVLAFKKAIKKSFEEPVRKTAP